LKNLSRANTRHIIAEIPLKESLWDVLAVGSRLNVIWILCSQSAWGETHYERIGKNCVRF